MLHFRSFGWLLLLALCALVLPASAQNDQAPPPVRPPPTTEVEEIPKPNLSPETSPRPPPAAQPPPQQQTQPKPHTGGDAGRPLPPPFGSKLFMGNFLTARPDGLNPDYVILPGDRVAVKTWGALEVADVFVVDGQGNIFLPSVGPVRIAGIKNSELTLKVKEGLNRVYARNFDVYTNLLTAKPVSVFVTGGVERPGRYAGIPSDSVLFFLDQAGGIDGQLGSYRKISVLRQNKSIAEVDLYDFLLRGQLPVVQFMEGDTVLVHRRGTVVELAGDVAVPALLEFSTPVVRGSDALAVVPNSARATQVTVDGIRGNVPISRTLAVDAFRGFTLQDGDRIILRDDGRADNILVTLEGEYSGPSVLAVRRGSRLVDVLNHVAVEPHLSNPNAVHLRRSSVAKAQKDSIDDALFRLERSALLALSQSQGEANIRVREAELTLKFVERARLIQPLGRVVTARDGQQRNITLEQDDVIVIPTRTNIVRVSGEVMMTQAVMFRPGATAEDYIRDAGGYTDRSDDDRVIVIHPNAEVKIGDPDLPIRPGDEVLVPPKIDSKVLQNTVDITQVIYQIAVSAAVVIAIL
jgi:protein involved in polysaccharide export with SLBB domain